MTDRNKEKRILELERRVKRLENLSANASYCYFTGQKKDEKSALSHTFIYKFNVQAFTYLKLLLKTQTACESYSLKIKINGASAYEQSGINANFQTECLLPFSEGVNEISVLLESQTAFTVESCVLETCGNISYIEDSYLVQVINEEERSIILSLIDEKLTIAEYKGEALTTVYEDSFIKSASLCKMQNGYLLAVIDSNYNGKIILLNATLQEGNQATFEADVISLCSLSGEQPRVFAVKGNKVYKYLVESNLSVQKSYTGLRGKRVKSNPEVEDYIIVIDYNGEAKLVKL